MRLLPDLEFAKVFHLTSCTGQRSPGRISGFPPALYPMILLFKASTPERRTDGNLPQAVRQPAGFVGSEEARLRASLRPPLKLHVRYSCMELSRRLKTSYM